MIAKILKSIRLADIFWFSKILTMIFMGLYYSFQKKMLSKGMTRFASKLFFYPTFPITVILRLGNYWTEIDDTVILGCAPMNIFGIPDALYGPIFSSIL